MIRTFIILSIAIRSSFSQLTFADKYFQSEYYFDNIAEEQQLENAYSGSDIHKHIFTYAAPDETSDEVIKVGSGPFGGIHYKILFIKAPGAPTPKIELPSQIGGPDVRVLVYVLQQQAKLTQLEHTEQGSTEKPQPPKVFFIKYNPRARK